MRAAECATPDEAPSGDVPVQDEAALLVYEVGGEEPFVILTGSKEAVRAAALLLYQKVRLVVVDDLPAQPEGLKA